MREICWIFAKKIRKKEPKGDFSSSRFLNIPLKKRADAQIHQNDAGKTANDAPFLAFAKLIAKGENADSGHAKGLESVPSGHHKCGIEVLHSEGVELLEHTKHHTN